MLCAPIIKIVTEQIAKVDCKIEQNKNSTITIYSKVMLVLAWAIFIQ
jgi:hypothetical protein